MRFKRGNMIIVFLFVIVGIAEVTAQSNNSKMRFDGRVLIHPGGFQTQEAMTNVRRKVSSNEMPWSAAWLSVRNADVDSDYVSVGLNSIVTNKGLLQIQGHATYVLAIKWVASGNKAYANAAIKIINNWVNTVETLEFTEAPLRVGIGSIQMANAAEILAHAFDGSAGWNNVEIDAAKKWFKNVIWTKIGTGGARSSNHGTSALAGCMSVAIFCDDINMFNYAVNAYKNGFTDAFRADGTADGCAGMSQYIAESTGQSVEAGRDQAHPQGGVAHLVETALIAWNQGVDLVICSDYRLIAGVEYLAKYNLGNDVPYTPNFADPCNVHPAWPVISRTKRGNFSPIYEMCNMLFNKVGVSHPYILQVIKSYGYSPEKTNSDHGGMGTLLYTE